MSCPVLAWAPAQGRWAQLTRICMRVDSGLDPNQQSVLVSAIQLHWNAYATALPILQCINMSPRLVLIIAPAISAPSFARKDPAGLMAAIQKLTAPTAGCGAL